MREYELYLVMDADAEDEVVNAVVERVTQLIALGDGQTSGEMLQVEARGKRRLTYTIKKTSSGQDILFTFKTPPQALPEVERILKLNEQVLRYLIIRTDEK